MSKEPAVHNPAASDDQDYERPACIACGRNLWQDEINRWACRPCELKTSERLTAIPGLFARLNTTAALVRGRGHTVGPTTGSKNPPIPANPVVLSLAATGGVATRLRDIEDAWRAALGWTIAPWRGNPGQAVPKHVGFLLNNLPWACDAYESVGQDIEEIRKLHVEITAALSPDRKPGRVKIGLCPVLLDDGTRCAAQLTATTANHKVHCNGCGTRWDDLAGWRDLRHAQQAVAAETAAREGAAA